MAEDSRQWGLSADLGEGLTATEARARLEEYGPNTLPEPRPPSIAAVFLRQFLSPLIYILLAAAVVSLMLSDVRDALFIGAVLLANGIIGTVQEYSAGQAAAALRKLEQQRASVIRDGLQQLETSAYKIAESMYSAEGAGEAKA